MSGLEGKAIRDSQGPWGQKKERAFCELIEAGGGGTADGGPWGSNGGYDALHADDASFVRAEAVVAGKIEPTAAEAVALERFQDAPRPPG